VAYPDDDLSEAAAAPSPFTAQSVYPADSGATNPALAKEFLDRHRADMTQRVPEIDNSLSKMQLNVDSMTKMLDDTVASIKAARSGRSNLPLMAMGAGMMTSTGNFGTQLGHGLAAMVPTIQKQRETDEASDLSLAQLGMRKAILQQAPLEAKLAYMKAMQTGDQSAVRAIEQALIRAQATSGNAADRVSQQQQKLVQTTVKNALDEARKQVDSMGKEQYATAEEREAEIQRRFAINLKLAKETGVAIPDDVMKRVTDLTGVPGNTAMKTRASYFDAPTNPEAIAKTVEAGLPPPPSGYIYEAIGPKDRPKELAEQTKNYRKESKDWDTQSKTASDTMAQLDTAETLLDKNPKLTGPIMVGPVGLPNNWQYNQSPDARSLKSIFTGIQLHNVPQGQGAVSDMERRLFENASPSMDNDVETNKRLIGIQREIFKRDKDRREFFSEYWNHYKTVDGMVPAWDRYITSPAGSAIGRDGAGNPVPNPNRLSWREYFKKERGVAGPEVPQSRAKGGAIKLGSEYD